MAHDEWQKMKRAKEDSYFENLNREALEKLRQKAPESDSSRDKPTKDTEQNADRTGELKRTG